MKQRVEVATTALRDVPMLVAEVNANPSTNVVAVKAGDVTWWDKAKEYYHTIFAAVTGVLVFVLTIAPALDPALALLPKDWQYGVGLALLVANAVLTRLKPNQVWLPAQTPPPAQQPPAAN